MCLILIQVSQPYKQAIAGLHGIVFYGPPGTTNQWQPVDSNIGAIVKRLIGQEQDDWLEVDSNIDLWFGVGDEKLTVGHHRVLLTHWVGNAWEKFCSSEYDHKRWRAFERTRCLITAGN